MISVKSERFTSLSPRCIRHEKRCATQEEIGQRLLLAIVRGNLEVVEALLHQGANVGYVDPFLCGGKSPLGVALQLGNNDIIKLLLEHQADVNHAAIDDQTALEMGIRLGSTDVVKLLLEHKADACQSHADIAADTGNADIFVALCDKLDEVDSSCMASLLSRFFMKDGSDPLVVAKGLLRQVAGQGVNHCDAAFAECRALDGLEVWFSEAGPQSFFSEMSGDKVRESFMKSINGEFVNLKQFFTQVVFAGRWANRLKRPVRVDLYEARLVTVQVLDDPKVVDALATTGNLDLFHTPLVECVIRHLWLSVTPWAYLDILINSGIVMAACLASMSLSTGASVDPLLWRGLAAATAKRLFEELAQFVKIWRAHLADPLLPVPEAIFYNDLPDRSASSIVKFALTSSFALASSVAAYALQLDTLFDLVFISLSVVSLRILDDVAGISPLSRFVLALWFGLLWLRLLYSLRLLQLVGPRFLPIFRTLQDTIGFYFVVAFTFAASVHSYLTLAVRAYPGPLYAAVIQMFKLYFFGDFDLHELEGVSPSFVQRNVDDEQLVLELVDPAASESYPFVHGLFYVIAVIFSVVLMNLFIGILGASYDIQEDVAMQVFLQSRAVAVAKYRSLPWVNACSLMYRSLVDQTDGCEHLCAFVRCSESDDSTRSLRSYLTSTERRINRKIDRKTMQLGKQMEKLSLDVKEMEENFQSMDQTIKGVNQNVKKLLQQMGLRKGRGGHKRRTRL